MKTLQAWLVILSDRHGDDTYRAAAIRALKE